nr:elongation factor G, mitochondrial-like [Tanacetum cinerariifolium]
MGDEEAVSKHRDYNLYHELGRSTMEPLPVENDPKQLKVKGLSIIVFRNTGSFIGFPVKNVLVVIMDGASRVVDSSELAMSYNICELVSLYGLYGSSVSIDLLTTT